LDLRKPKIKPKSESKSKKLAFLNKIPLKRKSGKSEAKTDDSETGSKGSKLKGAFGKIGNLKKAIPHKGKGEKKE